MLPKLQPSTDPSSIEYAAKPQAKKYLFSQKTRQAWMGYLFLLPIILFYLVFLIVPLIFSVFLSFTEWGGFDFSLIKWVGLQNFQQIFSADSPFLYPILTNTLLFAVGSVLFSFVVSLIVAYMITRLRFEGFWRTLYFLPMVTTVVAVGNVWKYMYDPNGGLLNEFLRGVGLPTVRFLSDPDTALGSLIVVAVWSSIGGSVLILTAGLKAIPESYYEAAVIDGASVFTLFWHITLPLLRPSILFVLITGFIGGLQSFTLSLVMTGDGGPGNATNVVGLEMYNQAFKFGSWGVASAMAIVLFVIVLLITLLQLAIFKRGGVESY
ncbi:sugar ABC transporter permease [Fictibacillus sp. B-59209]|uniref:carbohydrate ABC transporter permease n=1 Tax=Fictibacillus sp. B-59209 TaxID=3024873 RepID=UPI002E1CBCE1|nr:sugar ABC transporter permease [Fictibacillus sp. B-59209]